MAVADVGERVQPAEPLVARVDVDLRVLLVAVEALVAVEVLAVDVDVDAVDRVDGVGEALEVDVDDDGRSRWPVSCSTVSSVFATPPAVNASLSGRAVAGDLDLEVAGSEKRDRTLVLGIDAEQHRRV